AGRTGPRPPARGGGGPRPRAGPGPAAQPDPFGHPHPVIGVVCLNPALDITYHVPAVDWGGVNRPSSVRARPGGKGVNVARTLDCLGVDVLLMGLAGGLTGAEVVSALGVPSDFIPIGAATRRTVTVVDERGETAAFNEPGPLVSSAEFREFVARYEK